jgi:hypothetical protein
MNCIRQISICLILFAAPSAFACAPPSAPAIPDPAAAVLAEMVKAQKDVKKFLADAEAYLGCEKDTGKYNAMVDTMKATGDGFNQAIRAFKAKVKG